MHTSIAIVRIRGSPDFSAFLTLHRFKKVRLPLVPGRNNVKDAVRYLRLACSDRQVSWWSLGCASQGKATSRYLHSGERRHHQQWQDHNSSEIGGFNMSSTSRPVIHSSLDSRHGSFCPCGSTVPRPLFELRLKKGTFRPEWLSL
jgi:hypothetical protein